MKLIIAGGRDFHDKGAMESVLIHLYEYLDQDYGGYAYKWRVTEVVCGCAPGADTLGSELADEYKIPVKHFPADWVGLGVKAGPVRNKQMGDYADELLAFWDGKSKGTKHMIDYMNSLGKPVWVRMYQPPPKKANLVYPKGK